MEWINDNLEALGIGLNLIILILTIFWLRSSNKSLKQSINQYDNRLKNDFFTEYTRRYQEIKLHLPIGFFEENGLQEALGEDELRYARALFDLFSEEYYLHKSGKLEDEVWDEWKEEMLQTLKLPAVVTAWERLVVPSDQYSEFRAFINRI